MIKRIKHEYHKQFKYVLMEWCMQNRYDRFECVCNNNIRGKELFTVFTHIKYEASIWVYYLARDFINALLFSFPFSLFFSFNFTSFAFFHFLWLTESLFNFFQNLLVLWSSSKWLSASSGWILEFSLLCLYFRFLQSWNTWWLSTLKELAMLFLFSSPGKFRHLFCLKLIGQLIYLQFVLLARENLNLPRDTFYPIISSHVQIIISVVILKKPVMVKGKASFVWPL